ncbi:hypothetical protein F7725_004639, partial [Dissostichus mawsoni]
DQQGQQRSYSNKKGQKNGVQHTISYLSSLSLSHTHTHPTFHTESTHSHTVQQCTIHPLVIKDMKAKTACSFSTNQQNIIISHESFISGYTGSKQTAYMLNSSGRCG